MDDEGTNELDNLFLLLGKFSEEPLGLLRPQCRATKRQQKDIDAEMNLRAEMDLRECTMRGTACCVGWHVAVQVWQQNNTREQSSFAVAVAV